MPALSCVAGKSLLIASGRSSDVSAGYQPVLDGVVPVIRVLSLMGVRDVLLGFPATSLSTSMPVGTTVVVSDHINLTGTNPLFGHNEDRFGPRFPDCSKLYDTVTTTTASLPSDTAAGVLASVSGWCDASLPSERRWLLHLGAVLTVRGQAADAAIVARHMGMRTSAVAVISHCAAAESEQNNQAIWLPVVELPRPSFDDHTFRHIVETVLISSSLVE